MEIRGVSAVSIQSDRIYLRETHTSALWNQHSIAPRRSDGIVEEKAPRQIIDVIDLQTTEAQRATEAQRRKDAQHQVLRPETGEGRGVFLDIVA